MTVQALVLLTVVAGMGTIFELAPTVPQAWGAPVFYCE
jgi:hypothetical protein